MNPEEFNKQADLIGIGNKCRCKIDGVEIKDSRLQKEDGDWYICQNEKNGTECEDKLWYKYSWIVNTGSSAGSVEYLRPLEEYHNLVIHCPTQAEYDAIVELIGWHVRIGYTFDNGYGEETCVWCRDGKINSYGSVGHYKENRKGEYKDYTFKTAAEVLKEGGIASSTTYKNTDANSPVFGIEAFEAAQNLIRETSLPITMSCQDVLGKLGIYGPYRNKINKEKKPMLKKLSESLKRLFSPDQKKQYQAELINGDSSLTDEGREVMFDTLSQMPAVQEALTKRAKEIIKESKAK